MQKQNMNVILKYSQRDMFSTIPWSFNIFCFKFKFASLFCFVNFAIVQANSDHLPTKLEIGVRTDQVISHFMARFTIEKEFIGKDVISQIS